MLPLHVYMMRFELVYIPDPVFAKHVRFKLFPNSLYKKEFLNNKNTLLFFSLQTFKITLSITMLSPDDSDSYDLLILVHLRSKSVSSHIKT